VFAGVTAPVRNDDPTRNDPTSVAFELIGTPTVFGFLGYLADRALGTTPLIAVVAASLAFVTVLGLVIWRYNNDMEHAVDEHRTARASRGPRRARWEHDEQVSA
jgi:F0F1-type ATP synthase assembly protein I